MCDSRCVILESNPGDCCFVSRVKPEVDVGLFYQPDHVEKNLTNVLAAPPFSRAESLTASPLNALISSISFDVSKEWEQIKMRAAYTPAHCQPEQTAHEPSWAIADRNNNVWIIYGTICHDK